VKGTVRVEGGPVMKEGNYLLIDGISLVEDAVLERLNSVLEPARKVNLTKYSNRSAL